jgi:transcription elongation factor Elf1
VNWEELLAEKRVKPHKTSLSEIVQLREIVVRDLKDSKIKELSIDRRFACLYSAALQLVHMVTACAGYRVSAVSGHHKTSFEVLKLAMGKSVITYAVYFDVCRRKRNLDQADSSSS